MDKKQAIVVAKKYIKLVSEKYKIEKAYLFGSYAKENSHAQSDIDVAIVLNQTTDIIDTQIDLMKLRRKIDLNIEPHPFNPEDFNNSNPVVFEIMKYGIAI